MSTGSIGSIYDDQPSGKQRGPDLHATVKVPRAGLGVPGGIVVSLPPALPHEGEQVERAPQPGSPDDSITLHLPETFSAGATLRLRGAGGRGPDGCGDLYLKVALVDGEPVLPAPRGDTEISMVSPTSSSTSSSWVVIVLVAAAITLVYALAIR